MLNSVAMSTTDRCANNIDEGNYPDEQKQRNDVSTAGDRRSTIGSPGLTLESIAREFYYTNCPTIETYMRDPTPTEAEIADFMKTLENLPALDERKLITDQLDVQTHILVLEHNNGRTSRCHALHCLLESLPPCSHKIRAPYRLSLEPAKVTHSQHWFARHPRFYHVPCFEAIGVELTKYMMLEAGRTMQLEHPDQMGFRERFSSRPNFDQSVLDWLVNEDCNTRVGNHSKLDDALKVYTQQLRPEDTLCWLPSHKHDSNNDPPVTRLESYQRISENQSILSLTNLLQKSWGISNVSLLPKVKRLMLLEMLPCSPAQTLNALAELPLEEMEIPMKWLISPRFLGQN